MSVKMGKNSNSGGDNNVAPSGSRSLLSLSSSNIKTTPPNADKEKNVQQKKQENGHDDLKKENGHKDTQDKPREQPLKLKEKGDEKNTEKEADCCVASTSNAEIEITLLKPGPKSKKERDLKLLKEKDLREIKNITALASVQASSPKTGNTTKSSTGIQILNKNESPNSKSLKPSTAIQILNKIESPKSKSNKNELPIPKSNKNELPVSKSNTKEATIPKSNTNETLDSKSNTNETEKTKINEITFAAVIKSSQSFTSNVKSTEVMTKEIKKKSSDSEEMECLVYSDNDHENKDDIEKQNKIVDSRNDKSKPATFSSSEESPSKQTKLSIGNLKSNISLPITSTPEGNKLPISRPASSLRAISGRRSLHPSKEHSFQSQYRESYRKINTDLDYTNNTSLNVTVGSEPAFNDSNLSFSLWGRSGRKRDRTPPLITEHIEVVNIDSPKRARLDITSFLGMVASPVTMLRNRLSRTTIQSPSANEGVENLNDKIIERIIEDQGDEENSKQSEDLNMSNKTDDEPISNDLMEEEKNVKNLEEFEVIDDDDECEVVVKEVKRKKCSIM